MVRRIKRLHLDGPSNVMYNDSAVSTKRTSSAPYGNVLWRRRRNSFSFSKITRQKIGHCIEFFIPVMYRNFFGNSLGVLLRRLVCSIGPQFHRSTNLSMHYTKFFSLNALALGSFPFLLISNFLPSLEVIASTLGHSLLETMNVSYLPQICLSTGMQHQLIGHADYWCLQKVNRS